jgi:catechol 2,3-dioxygenase-like lactoylglutathione lyase family enzyme
MAKLRHIAIQVPDLEKAAAFYEGVFELKRLKKVEAPIGDAISLTDGVMNLTLLHFPAAPKAARAARIGLGCIISASSSTTRTLPGRRSRSTAASFS